MFGSGKGKEPMPASAQEDLGLAAEAQRVGESHTRSLFPVHVSDQSPVISGVEGTARAISAVNRLAVPSNNTPIRHSEDVPQSRGNLQEFLRLLKETAMGRIPDQDQQRSIIEFLDEIDPDYDPEFRELRSREGALRQVASQSQGVPTRTTANWKAIRDVSGLDIQRWICFRQYTPAEQALAIENVKGAYPGMSTKQARRALSQAVTRYKNDHRRREQKKAKVAADAVVHAAGEASTPDRAASRVVAPISTPLAASQDRAGTPTLGDVAYGGNDHDVLPMADPASPGVGSVSPFGADSGGIVGVSSAGLAGVPTLGDVAYGRNDHDVLPMADPASSGVGSVSPFGADSGGVVGVPSAGLAGVPTLGDVAYGGNDHDVLPMADPASPGVVGVSPFGADSGGVVGVPSAGLGHVLPKADVASPRGARVWSTPDSTHDEGARFSEQKAGRDGAFDLSIVGPASSPGVGGFSPIADVSCPHVGDMAFTYQVNCSGGAGGSTAGEAAPSSVGASRGVRSTAAPPASVLGEIRVSLDGDLDDIVGNAVQGMEVDVGSPAPAHLFRSMKEEAPVKDQVEIELRDGESGGMDAKGRRSEA